MCLNQIDPFKVPVAVDVVVVKNCETATAYQVLFLVNHRKYFSLQ